MIMKSFLFFIFLFSAALLTASPQIDHPLSISELIDIALENNPETRQAWWNANRAAAAVGNARSDYYPSSDISLSVKNGREFRFINGPDTNYTILGADLTLYYILFDFGTRNANVNAAKSALKAAGWQNNWAIQNVMVQVLKNAYSFLHSQEALGDALVSLKEAETVFQASRELNAAGLVPITDVYASESAFIQMKMEAVQQKAFLNIEKGKLATSLGLPALTQIELSPIEITECLPLSAITELIDLANERRSDLIAKRAKLCESLYLQKRVQASYRPNVSLTGYGGANHAIHDKANAGQYQLLLNVDIPLFNGFETTYQNRMAYADTKMTKESLAELELDIAQEVLTNSYSLQAAIELIALAKENLNSASKAYQGVLEKYHAGKENIFDLSTAQRQLAQSRLRYSEIKTRLLVAMANLAYSTGTLDR